jgi:hypothetical protein
LLFREAEAANAKIWVDSGALIRLWPARFGTGTPTPGEMTRLRERVEHAEVMAERAWAEADRLKQELDAWRRR